MKIEILKDKKQIRPTRKPKPIKELNMVEVDFSSINGLKTNKNILEFLFHKTKIELLQNG